MRLRKFDQHFGVMVISAICSACGGGGGNDEGGNAPPPAPTHWVGGIVSGLAGTGLTLRVNGGSDLAIGANGSYTFTTRLASGAAYSVAVVTQPSSPSQTCTAANTSGTVANVAVTNIAVTCTTNQYIVGGTVSGLSGSGLAVTLNGGAALTVANNGSFQFPTRVASGGAFAVAIAAQPANPVQECALAGAGGTVASGDVASVQISCIDLAGTVGGTVSGLRGAGLELRNNGADTLIVSADGHFRFGAAIAPGGSYAVTVGTQPRLPRQVCTVTHATGSTSSSPVDSVRVDCGLNPGNLRTAIPAPNYPTGSGELATFTSLDFARNEGGFGRLAQDVRLDAAARAHAQYLAARFYAAGRFDRGALSANAGAGGIAAHVEQPGSPSFTGNTPADRARAAGYEWTDGAEAAIFNVGTASRDCSDQILDSVVLRNRMLNTEMREIGIGIADTADGKGFACVVIAAYADVRGEAPTGWVGVYPFDSATPISLAMASDATGDDYGSNRGMPVMFMADREAPLSLAVTIRKSATNALVNTTTITSASLPDELTPNQVFTIPSIYLDPDTAYVVSATGTVEGLPVDHTTQFTTGARSHSAPFVPELGTGTLRAIYAYPADRTVRDEYRQAAQVAMEHLQGWFQQQLGGETFSLYAAQPEVCALPRDSAYYLDESWSKIQTDIQTCVPVRFGDPDHDWVIFADVIHGCDLPGYLDAGWDTLTMMQRKVFEGLLGRDNGLDSCGRADPPTAMLRWIGLVGHEVGHTFNLPHPCNTYQVGCDVDSLMWEGSARYPAAYFAPTDRATLLAHRFINVQRFGR